MVLAHMVHDVSVGCITGINTKEYTKYRLEYYLVGSKNK